MSRVPKLSKKPSEELGEIEARRGAASGKDDERMRQQAEFICEELAP